MSDLPAVTRRRSARARRVSLRINAAAGVAELVVPIGVSDADADRFAAKHRDWVAARLAELPARHRFADGMSLPVLGDSLRVVHDPNGPRAVRHQADDGMILVGGRSDQLAARLETWLREVARATLFESANLHAEALGRRLTGLRVGDPRTRWGSCSPRGVLSFSWRLVLAPPWVLDYVAAHEAAHLREMNHGPRFWALVSERIADHARPRAWLSEHGPGLHRYGG